MARVYLHANNLGGGEHRFFLLIHFFIPKFQRAPSRRDFGDCNWKDLNDEQKENRLVLFERLQETVHKRLEWDKISGKDNAPQKLLSHSMPVVSSSVASAFYKRSAH